MPSFRAAIALLGINPYVSVPAPLLLRLFKAAGRETGPLPITVTLAGTVFKQNLVKYRGAWRLYLNTPMRQAAQKDVGERVALTVEFDPEPRVEQMHPKFRRALTEHAAARTSFEALTPYRQREIVRYLNQAKTDVTRDRNIAKTIRFLLGEEPPGLAALTRPTRR